MADFDPELISAYLDGELSRDEQAQVEAWLAESEEARQVLQQLCAVSGAVRSLPRSALDERFAAEVLQAIEQREAAAAPRESPRDAGPRAPLGVVRETTHSTGGSDALSETLRAAPPVVRAARPVWRQWRWMAPAGGIAAAVLVAVWVTQRSAGPERVAQLAEAPHPVAKRAAESAGRLRDTSPEPLDSAAARPMMSKVAAEPASKAEAPVELESMPKGGFAVGGLGGAGGIAGPDSRGRNDRPAEGGKALSADVPLVQTVEELNPTLAVDSIDRTGAAVVVVSGDNRTGMTALQRALTTNAILTDERSREQPLAESRESLRELPAKGAATQDSAPPDVDALYVIATPDQLRGALRSLKEGQKSAGIEKITLQGISPETFQQQLGEQSSLAKEAASPEAEMSNRALLRSRDAKRAGEKDEAAGRSESQGRASSSPRDLAQAAQGVERVQFGRQYRLKFRGAVEKDGQLKVQGWQALHDQAQLQPRTQRGAELLEQRNSESLSAGAAVGKPTPVQQEPAPPETTPSLMQRFAKGQSARRAGESKLAGPAPPKLLQVLFLFESIPPAAAKSAPTRAEQP